MDLILIVLILILIFGGGFGYSRWGYGGGIGIGGILLIVLVVYLLLGRGNSDLLPCRRSHAPSYVSAPRFSVDAAGAVAAGIGPFERRGRDA